MIVVINLCYPCMAANVSRGMLITDSLCSPFVASCLPVSSKAMAKLCQRKVFEQVEPRIDSNGKL